MTCIFRKIGLFHPCHTCTGAVQKYRIIQRVGGEDMFQIGRGKGIEMHTAPEINLKSKRRLSLPARMERAQESILQPNQRNARICGGFLASRGIGRLPPYGHRVTRLRQPRNERLACEFKNAADAFLPYKSSV